MICHLIFSSRNEQIFNRLCNIYQLLRTSSNLCKIRLTFTQLMNLDSHVSSMGHCRGLVCVFVLGPVLFLLRGGGT